MVSSPLLSLATFKGYTRPTLFASGPNLQKEFEFVGEVEKFGKADELYF